MYLVLFGNFASVARGNLTSSVLVAKCVDSTSSSESLNAQAVEEFFDTPNSGVIHSYVRYKNKKKMFVTFDNEVVMAKVAAILNNMPEFHTRFELTSNLNMSTLLLLFM